ncbi:TrmB family transcriptional regulator [Patescibacteria group bacterium]|nr:TrmB family transcriptional regulator [Patescibacteria group bacterium]MBU1891049.1 TrmB family transcriptional regulator [Patescibacteria group bacterium]
MTIERNLQKFGFSDKEISVYLALLQQGPSSVRKIATAAKVNRGTTYDILKSLRQRGLVSYYHQDKHQYFVAEDPEKLKQLHDTKQQELDESKKELKDLIPELKSIYEKQDDKPVVKFYEGHSGIKTILTDVLDTMSSVSQKKYCVYSSFNIRSYLYYDFPNFSKERIKRKISVKIIALGEGGEPLGLDERRWLSQKKGSPTYIIIYDKKTALISVTKDKIPMGIIIEDSGLAQTQKFLFEQQWKNLST